MGGVARSELVAAVSAAGGFGLLGMVRESPDLIRSEIARVRAATTREFGVNLIPAATDPDLLEAELDAVIAERVAAVMLFWDLRPDIVHRLRDSGCLVLCQVGSIREAEAAAAAGAQIVIAQGFEAGGHVRGTTNLADLVPDVVARVDVPVLAAGGIVDGRGLAAALRWGAQGAVVGTGFLATRESFAHDYHKRRLVEAKPGETIHTEAFHVNWPRGAPVRVLPNSVTRGEHGNPFCAERQIIGQEKGRPIYLFSTDSPLRDMTGDFEAVVVQRSAPVEFWRWHPGMPMQTGVWNIPIPKQRDILTPDAVIVPLVGFDGSGYRLGYGGGYFDRTLALAVPRPFAIGLGYADSALQTIYPQPHDIPMNLIVTDQSIYRVASTY